MAVATLSEALYALRWLEDTALLPLLGVDVLARKIMWCDVAVALREQHLKVSFQDAKLI